MIYINSPTLTVTKMMFDRKKIIGIANSRVNTSRNLILGISCLLMLGNTVFAQEIFVSESRNIRNDDAYAIIGKIDEHILLFIDRADKYELQAYDNEMQAVWTKDITLDSRRAKILDISQSGDNFTIIYKHSKRGKILTQAAKFDGKGELVKKDTAHIQANRGFYSLEDQSISEDERFVLIYEFEFNTRIYATVYDLQNMETTWHKVFSTKDIDIERDFVQGIVDNTGTPYFIFSKNNRRTKREENCFYIISYDAETEQAVEINVPINGQIWFDVQFKYDNLNERMVGAGLFLDKRYTEATGYFYLNFDPKQPNTQQTHFQDFDPKFVVRAIGKETKHRSVGEVSVQDLILTQDGGVLMIAERNRFYSRTGSTIGNIYAANQAQASRMDYHFEDILLLAIHPDGKLHWNDVLQKRQFSQDDGARFSSYFLMHTPRSLRFVYNDEIRYKTNVNEYLVGTTGNQQRNSIYNTEAHDVSFILREAKQIAANEAIIASERRNNLKLARLVYE